MKKIAVALLISLPIVPLTSARADNPLTKLRDAIAAKNARESAARHKERDRDSKKDTEKKAPSGPPRIIEKSSERPRNPGISPSDRPVREANRPETSRPDNSDRDRDRPRNPNPPRDDDRSENRPDNRPREDHDKDRDHDKNRDRDRNKDRDRPRTVIIERPVYIPSAPIYIPAPVYDPLAEQARRDAQLLEIVARQMRFALRENPILKPYKLDTDTVGDSVEIHGLVDNIGQLQLALDVARNIDPRTRIVLTRIRIRGNGAPIYTPPAYDPPAPNYPPPPQNPPADSETEGNLEPC